MITNQELADRLLDEGLLEIGSFEFNDGTHASGKLNWDNIREDGQGFDRSATLASGIINAYGVDLVIPMPEGANRLGIVAASKADVGSVLLEAPTRKTLKSTHEAAMEILNSKRIALVDDITRTGGTFNRGAALIPNVVVCMAVWDRSDNGIYSIRGFENNDIPVEALIRRPVSLDGDIL